MQVHVAMNNEQRTTLQGKLNAAMVVFGLQRHLVYMGKNPTKISKVKGELKSAYKSIHKTQGKD